VAQANNEPRICCHLLFPPTPKHPLTLPPKSAGFIEPSTLSANENVPPYKVRVHVLLNSVRAERGSVAKIVKLEQAWRRLDGRNDDGFQVAPFPGRCDPVVGALALSLSHQLSRT